MTASTGSFIRWIGSFRRRQRPRILELPSGYHGEIAVVTRRRDLKQLTTALSRSAGSIRERDSEGGQPNPEKNALQSACA